MEENKTRLRDATRDPLTFFLNLSRDQGDVARYRSAPEPAYLVNHPDYVKHVLVDNNRNYVKDTFINSMFKSYVGDGLLTSEGEVWRAQRRMMQPAFHHKRLESLDATITGRTQAMLERWDDACRRGEPVLITQEMAALTLAVATEILFGVDLGEDVRLIEQAVDMGGALLEKPKNPRFREAINVLMEIVDRIIAARRRGDTEHDDLLSTLLQARDEDTGEGMDDELLRHQVVTLLLGGYETTASALTWTWYLLSQHPEIAERLQAETRTVLDGRPPTSRDLETLSYALMVFEEAMRVYPPAWIIGRRALGDDQFGETHILAGTVIAISPYTLHRHLQYWDQPEVFDPQRFTPERSAGRHKYAYIPFGGGPRQCIGNTLSLIEGKLILSMVSQRFAMELVEDHPLRPEVVFVLRPDRQMKMHLTPL
jgi:cytochrome P450